MLSDKNVRRPLFYPDDGKMEATHLRVTAKQKEKLAKLGGGKWMRKQIDAAKVK